jgi:hypothetical protein
MQSDSFRRFGCLCTLLHPVRAQFVHSSVFNETFAFGRFTLFGPDTASGEQQNRAIALAALKNA